MVEGFDSIDQVLDIVQWRPFATRRVTSECCERRGSDDHCFL